MLALMTKCCWWISAIGVALVSALITIQVGMRWCLGETPSWAEELPSLILVWLTLFGAVRASFQNSHLNAGILPLWMRHQKGRSLSNRLVSLIILFVLVILMRAGWNLSMLTMSQQTPAMNLPVGLLYLSVPITCIPMIAVYLAKLFARDGQYD